MARPQEKLADSLAALEALQRQGLVALRSADLSRTHRERLLRSGFLRQVIRGWYIPTRPDEARGESTAWYAGFWDFCGTYLEARFGDEWSLSPEQSLFLQTGNRTVPRQLLVRAPGARNKNTDLPHDTSIVETRAQLPPSDQTIVVDGLRLFSLPAALVAAGSGFFAQNPTEARTALAMIADASDLLRLLLEGGRSTIAGRLAGAFRNLGRDRIADEILATMRSAGYDTRERDPFPAPAPFTAELRALSPYASRMQLMWRQLREPVIAHFPAAPGLPSDPSQYLKSVDEIYIEDAYHSLSIEGYRVDAELIARVRSGAWNPDGNDGDGRQRDAMAARGYFEAFQSVKASVRKVLGGEKPGRVADDDHPDWYRRLFAPSVAAGLIKAADLAGYRSDQVYIRHSKHVPPKRDAVREMMPALFALLTAETDAGVRAVLGHFMFVYIHPYVDGNGRIGRFLMNVMLAAGGYPWTVVPLECRKEYMAALEAASTGENIEPFASFLSALVRERSSGAGG